MLIKYLNILVLVIIGVIFQVNIFPVYLADPFKPNVLLIFVVYFGFRAGFRFGAPCSFLLGLVQDSFSGIYFGLNAFSYLLIFTLYHEVAARLYTGSRALLVLGTVLAVVLNAGIQFLLLLLSSSEGAFSSIFRGDSSPRACNSSCFRMCCCAIFTCRQGGVSMRDQRFIREVRDPSRRLLFLTIGVSILFFVLLMRLWYLQIVKSEEFQNLSENNRLRLAPVAASRGTILDRNGEILVDNLPSFSITVIPQEVTDKDGLLKSLSRLVGMNEADLAEKWLKGSKRSRYQPIILASNITRDQLEILEENRLSLPGLDVAMHPIRAYSHGLLGAHLFGHLGEISEQEMGNDRFKGYNPGDYVGKSGIERNWEKELHGVDGGRQIEVDARGRFLRTVSERSPITGNSLVLTIDLELQKAAEAAFGEQAGAAVALGCE